MADDPLRQQIMKFLDAQYPHARLADHQFAADSLLRIFAKADPWRAMLADEDRASLLVYQAVVKERPYWGSGGMIMRGDVRSVLAALREVAGNG